jgi:hypothetical protein
MRRLLTVVAAAGLVAWLLRRRAESDSVTVYYGDGSAITLSGREAEGILGKAYAILGLAR